MMSSQSMRARRATVDDLAQLSELWRLEQLPVDEFEKRFTEFQVVGTEIGEVLGTAGLEIAGSHGILYGEAIARPETAEQVRDLLWKRLQMVARNHNLDRIWTRLAAPFWRSAGFRAASEEELETAPATLASQPGWQLLWLRTGDASSDAIEKQFAMLRALNAEEAQKLQKRVATIKRLALALTVVVALLVLTWAFVLFRYGPRFLNRAQ